MLISQGKGSCRDISTALFQALLYGCSLRTPSSTVGLYLRLRLSTLELKCCVSSNSGLGSQMQLPSSCVGHCFNGDPLRWFPQWVCLALKAHRDPLKCRLRHPCPMALLSTQHRGVGRPPRWLRRAVVEWGASCVMWDGGPQHLCPLPSPPPRWKGFCPQGPGNCRPVTGGTVG